MAAHSTEQWRCTLPLPLCLQTEMADPKLNMARDWPPVRISLSSGAIAASANPSRETMAALKLIVLGD
eukprot:2612513-Karenia_brevis.AAC.1